jgi:plasmid maintenance system killer protein
VGKDLQRCIIQKGFQSFEITTQITTQKFQTDLGKSLMNSIQTLPVVGRSTILHIVPIDHCDNCVGEAHGFYGIRQISRFIQIRRWRVANSVHRTKTAATGTGLACNHESGSSTAPAIMYIGTVGFFTDSV